jgi:hypothetical protein
MLKMASPGEGDFVSPTSASPARQKPGKKGGLAKQVTVKAAGLRGSGPWV